jgi:uncharacterized protein YuzE
MRLEYDLDVGALYVSFSDRDAARTRSVGDNVNVDLDEDGNVAGIEIISFAHPWPLDEVLRDYHLPASEEAQLRAYFPPTRAPDAPTFSAGRVAARSAA